MCALSGSESCGVTQAWLYQEEALKLREAINPCGAQPLQIPSVRCAFSDQIQKAFL